MNHTPQDHPRFWEFMKDIGMDGQAASAKYLGEIDQLRAWISDLQSGMFINCVYCGHRYGPADQVPASKAEVLKQHIARCPEHPMSRLVQASGVLIGGLVAFQRELIPYDDVVPAILALQGVLSETAEGK